MNVQTLPYAIDISRILYKKAKDPKAPYDTSAPDSVWIAVVGNNIEDIISGAAKTDVTRYVTEAIGPCDGIDMEEGPAPDDGKMLPTYLNMGGHAASNYTMSAEEYLNVAARRQMKQPGPTRYVAYYRVRRLALL